MNKSKKPIKSNKKVNKKQFTINPKIWIILASVLGLVLIVAVLFDQLYKRPLVTIDGKDYYVEDMTYQFFTTESYHDYIDQLYGGNYWDMPYSESSTISVRDFTKAQTINNVIYQEILYNEAVSNGYTLTQEESESIDEEVDTILKDENLSEKIIKKNGFTSDYLKSVLTKTTLVNRYIQDVIDTLDIDEEAIKADFDYEEYRQYDIEYLFISTEVNKEDNTTEPMNEEDKKAALDKITSLRKDALEAEDWKALIPEDEEQLEYRESNFLPTDTYFPEDFMNTLMAMENQEISEVLETEDGYYIVRMINNNSSETYDKVVKDAITAAEDEAFSNEYFDNILPKHSYETHDSAIKRLRMGRITLVK
ncbi:MAG: hypothetical protein GX321_02615 [Clostridiales bacterium]|nr:hypothetical protein [Clostridiales bacterium]